MNILADRVTSDDSYYFTLYAIQPFRVIGHYHSFDLPVARQVIIPELAFALVSHNIRIEPSDTAVRSDTAVQVFIMPVEGVFMERSLLVGIEPVAADGEVLTRVFNLSHKPARIRKGDVISQLVRL